jgi:CBS domain-containing protein
MKVREIMSTNVQQISGDSTVKQAADQMKSSGVGALPVFEQNRLIGMLTDRDIVLRAVAAGRDPNTTSVKEIVTPRVFSCSEEDDIESAARIMEENQVRRLVVISRDNRTIGILSISDLATKSHNEHLSYEVLEKICEPVGSF